jgi:hypothetical protein
MTHSTPLTPQPPTAGSGPVKIFFHALQHGRTGEGNKAGRFKSKMAAGRKYRRHDKPPPNYSDITEKDNNTCNIFAPWAPFHTAESRVICIGFAPLSTSKPICQRYTKQPVFPSLILFTDIWQHFINDLQANRKNTNTLTKCMHLREWKSKSRSHYKPVHVSNSTITAIDKSNTRKFLSP